MRYNLLLLSIYFCYSCLEGETSPMMDIPMVIEDTLTAFDKNILTIQDKIQDDLVEELYILSLPKLPHDKNYLGKLQLSALEFGSQKALYKVYQKISIPYENNNYDIVKHLDLSYQNIHFIPNKITRYHNLQYLSLKSNLIQAINPKLSLCKKLRKVDLSSNGLKKIPFEMIFMTQIKELVLADNNLTTLPSFLFKLINLKSIDISNFHTNMAEYYNDIQHVPKVLFRMPGIEKLFLDKLPLRNLPDDLNKMTSLKVISLNGVRGLNLFQAFNVMAEMPNLIALDLSFIGRQSLPSNIAKLQNLKVLVWHEEEQMNQGFILETLKDLLPGTKVYFGEKGVATPFLRGNSISTLKSAGY